MPSDDWDDERPLEEWEYPDPDDADDEKTCTQECPMCGADVYEDAVQCPLCGEYMVARGRRAWEGRPLWWIVLGLLGIMAVIWAFLPI
jgi:predicted nucleic acid-binding Zn ribbon protein